MPCRKTANRSALMYAGLTLLAGLALPASVDAETAATHRQPGDTAACEALQGRTLGPARVTQARMVVSASSVAACEVTAVKADRPGFLMRATLPQHWSGDLVHGGGGGMDGTLPSQIWAAVQPNQRDMVYLVSNGGHVGSSGADASNFAQDPEGRLDYAYRAIGYTDDFGDALTASYYGQKPGHRYFVGCSKGGFDALQAARFYPQRYDGIVAQAPAPHIDAWVAWVGYYGTLTPLPNAKWSMLYQAYLNTCDSLDGLSDGVVSNIGACRFDPASVPGLTPQERRTVNAIASDLKLKDGTVVYPGYWWGPQFKAFDAMGSLGQEWMRRMIFKDPAYDPASFDLETAWPRIQAVNAPFKDNIPSDAIADYLKSGRKLIMITAMIQPNP